MQPIVADPKIQKRSNLVMVSRRASAPWRRMRRRSNTVLVAAAAIGLAPVAAHATPADLYFERSVMAAANQRCGLFGADLTSALESAQAQARGAALRAGSSAQSLSGLQQRASARASQAACSSKDMAEAASRVRSAFDGYARLQRMTFPGDTADWRADRAMADHTLIWRLIQSARFGQDSLGFGLAGQGGASALVAVASFADGAEPYSARLVLRDVSRAGEPCLGQAGRGLAARLPLPGARKAYLAEARDPAPARLLPAGARSGLAFRFPRAAADALAGLDPREAVAVEFLFSGRKGESVRTAYVEVGDFAAGRAFLAAAQR